MNGLGMKTLQIIPNDDKGSEAIEASTTSIMMTPIITVITMTLRNTIGSIGIHLKKKSLKRENLMVYRSFISTKSKIMMKNQYLCI